MKRQIPIALILLAYLVIAALFAALTPAWQAPDEPAHYNYVRQLAAGDLPVIEAGDYDQAYQSAALEARFDGFAVDNFEYEDWQPPLYYLLLTPVYLLTSGSLLALRLVSVLLGAGVVWLTFVITRRLFPEHQWWALTAAAFVAFLPQHVAMLASVNNDALAEFIIALIFFFLLDWLSFANPRARSQDGQLVRLGVLLGLGLLTKATVYLLAPLLALVLFQLYRPDWSGLGRAGLRLGLPALLLGGLWWGRNLVIYGGLDVMGTAAHDAVVVGQLRTGDWLADVGPAGGLTRFLTTTFNSFWGQFGWMGVPMPGWVYAFLLLFTLATLAGLVVALRRQRGRLGWSRATRYGWSLALLFAFNLLLYLGYNVTFVQHQGRYFFPALLPIGIGVAFGWDSWIRPLFLRSPKLSYLMPVGLTAALAGLDLLALFVFIIPNLSP